MFCYNEFNFISQKISFNDQLLIETKLKGYIMRIHPWHKFHKIFGIIYNSHLFVS